MAQAQLEDDGEGLDIDVYWASPRPVMRIELVGDTAVVIWATGRREAKVGGSFFQQPVCQRSSSQADHRAITQFGRPGIR